MPLNPKVFLLDFDLTDGPFLNEVTEALEKKYPEVKFSYDVVDINRFKDWMTVEIHSRKQEAQ